MAADRRQLAWLLIGARLLLLAEGLVQWWLLLRLGFAVVYLALLGLVFILGPALFLGIPAFVMAFKPRLNLRSRWTTAFLVANTIGAILDLSAASRTPDPNVSFAALAAVSIGANVLLLLVAYKAPVSAAWLGVAGVLVALGYSATYALPPTAPPAPALHLEGVLNVPPATHSVLSVDWGGDVIGRLDLVGDSVETSRQVGTVNPGSYQVGQDCPETQGRTWSSVHVPVGATVTAEDLCPLFGTLEGTITLQHCASPGDVTCRDAEPFAGKEIDLLVGSAHYAHRVTTDATGHYSVKLWPGTYRVEQRVLGGHVAAGPASVTIQSRSTTRADLILRP